MWPYSGSAVKEALDLDHKNRNTLWADAIAKEMKEVCIAFNVLPDGHSAPIGYQKIPCHMIFDVKMEDFKQKARLVAGGHRTKAPATITYASVVSRETMCLALTIASLNDLKVKVGDVLNAYITAPVKKKVWTIFLDLNLDIMTQAKVLSLCVPCMDLTVQVQHFELILLPLCAKWDIHPVRLTPTCG
jgi:hypothetical protein